MNSSLQFFMLKEDEKDFLEKFKNDDFDYINEEGYPTQIYYQFGEEHIQFCFSKQFDEILTVGRIALKTKASDNDAKRAERLYKRMRNWIKKTYICDLFVYNTKTMKKEEAQPVMPKKSFCASVRCKKLMDEQKIILKQYKNTFSEFYIKNNE